MSPDRTEPQGGRISLESADLAELLDRVSADPFAAGRDAVYEHEKAGLVTAPDHPPPVGVRRLQGPLRHRGRGRRARTPAPPHPTHPSQEI